MLLPFLFFIMIATWAFPQSAVLFRSYWTIFRTVGGYYAGQAWKTALWVSVVYFALLAVLSVAAVICMMTQSNIAFAILCLILALSISPLNNLVKKVASSANLILPAGARINEPKVTTVLILVILNAAITALFFSPAFFSWYGPWLLALLIVGETMIIAFPSDKFFARYVLGGLTAATFILGVFCAAFPADAERPVIAEGFRQQGQSRENILAKMDLRKVETVIAKNGADVWELSTDWMGNPKIKKGGFPDIKLFQQDLNNKDSPMLHLEMNQKFMLREVKAVSIDAGEQLIPILLPRSDGKWLQDGSTDRVMYIAVSDTSLSEAPPPPSTIASAPGSSVTSPSSSQPATGTHKVFVDARNYNGTSVGYVASGSKITINGSGTAVWKNINPGNPTKHEECGPGGTSPTGSPLISREEYFSNIGMYMCPTALKGALIAKIGDGSWFPVGSNYKGVASSSGTLLLAINDLDPSKANPSQNWSDNSKGFDATVNVE